MSFPRFGGHRSKGGYGVDHGRGEEAEAAAAELHRRVQGGSGSSLDRPRAWSPSALTELRDKLARSRYRFSIENLQRPHELTYRKALVDVISMVKHAADAQAPLLNAS